MHRLKELRESKKLTQSQLGEQIGAKKSAISLWESGKRQPDQDTLIRLAALFGVSVDYLLGRDEQGAPAQQNTPADMRAEAKALLEGMSDEQYQAALQYLKFLKSQK